MFFCKFIELTSLVTLKENPTYPLSNYAMPTTKYCEKNDFFFIVGGGEVNGGTILNIALPCYTRRQSLLPPPIKVIKKCINSLLRID